MTRLRAPGPAKLSVKVRRKKICENPDCRVLFVRERDKQRVCGDECAAVVGKIDKEAAERKSDRVRKQRLKTKSAYEREAQVACNAVVRERDRQAGYPCISSGKPLDWTGNAVDAGHYRSRGSAPHLRFNLWNIHAQSKQENRYNAGNAIDYRINLIARIGLARVEALEADNTPRKHDIAWLKRFTAIMRRKLRRMQKRRGE